MPRSTGTGATRARRYFFKGDAYVRFDWAADRVDQGFPAPLSAWNLPAEFARGVDAALNGDGPFAGKAYFFKGARYVRYDWATDRCDPGYPAPLSAWNLPGAFASGVDACWAGRAAARGQGLLHQGRRVRPLRLGERALRRGYPKPLSARGLPPPLSGAVPPPSTAGPPSGARRTSSASARTTGATSTPATTGRRNAATRAIRSRPRRRGTAW